MRLNVEKCKVMHFGKSNPTENYYMTDDSENEINIEETRIERDLGVNVGYDLKWSGHVDRIVEKANRILGMLKRTFESRTMERSLCFPSMITLRVCCASMESTFARRH